MVKTAANPGGLPKDVFDGLQAQLAGQPQQVLLRPAGRAILWLQPARCRTLAGGDLGLVAPGHDGRRQAHYDGIVVFSRTDFTEGLKKISCRCW